MYNSTYKKEKTQVMLLDRTPFHTVAATYGSDVYGCGRYEVGGDCQTTTEQPTTNPDAPLTGFLSQPPYIVLPALLGVAIIIGSISYLISRKLRKHK